MSRDALSGRAQTVLGLVDGNSLGFTLPHEHLILGGESTYFVEPDDPRDKDFVHQPVTLENLHWVRYHHISSVDNWHLDDERTAIREAKWFKETGGRTIVDVTPNNIGRNPDALVRISQGAGINVIMGTGYYFEQSYSPEMNMDSRTEADIADEFVRDISSGVNGTGICAGVIGELGCSWPLTKNERKVLRAAANAQQRTGAVITIHPGHDENGPLEIVKVLTEAGAQPERIIMGHISLTIPPPARSARSKLAETGCYIQYDEMGTPELQAFLYRAWWKTLPYMDFANDFMRIDQIKDLVADGFLNSILMSIDVCLKTCLASYGGPGYVHIREMIMPLMLQKGFTEEQINTITVDNPRRAMSFA